MKFLRIELDDGTTFYEYEFDRVSCVEIIDRIVEKENEK